MPFPLTGRYPVSAKDILSFTFDDPDYNVDRPVLIDPADPSKSLSHKQARIIIRKVIAGLRSLGLHKGDAICIHSFNSIYYPVLVLAIIGAGYVFVGTNPGYTALELIHAIRVARVKLVLSEPGILSSMREALAVNSIPEGSRLLILDTFPSQFVPDGFKSWRTLLVHGERDWIRFNSEDIQSKTTACLFYTSGTTGLPKCAMVSHRNLVAQHTLFCLQQPQTAEYQVRTVQMFPPFHIGAFPIVLISQFREGRASYMMRRFQLESYLEAHAKYDITEVFCAPPVVVNIVMSGLADPTSPNYNPRYSMRSVKRGFVGAAPLSADMQTRFAGLMSEGVELSQIWGMTETTSMISTVPSSYIKAGVDHVGSVGLPMPEIELKLVDENDNDSTATGKGEAFVRGPTVIRGYFENERANRASWDAEGYYRTGDVLERNSDTGLFCVVERKKELIKVRGFQVAPAEIEGVLTAHRDITDAAVIGVPDEKNGELPRAYVVLKEGSSLTAEAISKYAGERLTRYKALVGGVVMIREIPKSASGKILKRVLRERAKEELQAPAARL